VDVLEVSDAALYAPADVTSCGHETLCEWRQEWDGTALWVKYTLAILNSVCVLLGRNVTSGASRSL
jgi:hypothetical protein